MIERLCLEMSSNGVIVTCRTPDDDGTGEFSEVIEFHHGNELEGVQRLLYMVLDWTGYAGSKHDERRIWVDIRSGETKV